MVRWYQIFRIEKKDKEVRERGKKRKRGMGSIFKHGTSWWIAFYDRGKQVKERVGSIGLITKGQAGEALKSRMGEVV